MNGLIEEGKKKRRIEDEGEKRKRLRWQKGIVIVRSMNINLCIFPCFFSFHI